METITLLEDMNIYKENIRNSKGNKVRKNRILKAGTYEVVKKWTDTGMVRHGNTIVQVKDNGYTFIIDLSDVELVNLKHKANSYCKKNNMELININKHKNTFMVIHKNSFKEIGLNELQ